MYGHICPFVQLMKRYLTLCLLLLTIPLCAAVQGPSHDLASLDRWGPYSKEYFGISHISDLSSGIQVEFCLVSGIYRRNFKVPCALFESDVHPWSVSADMKHITYRHEIEWKDRVYVDATYHILDEDRVLLETHCINNTPLVQNISLQLAVRKVGGTAEQWTPEITEGKGCFSVKYPEVADTYSVVWDYPLSEVREWKCARLEQLMPPMVHNHTSKRLKGDLKGHYTANFLRPVVLRPQSDTTVWQVIVRGPAIARGEQTPDSQALTQSALVDFNQGKTRKTLSDNVLSPTAFDGHLSQPGGQAVPLGVQLMQATLLTNVVYPIDAFGEPIRHFCPGKNWNSLYTWDCGFIGWAMSEIAPGRGYEIIRQYTTAPEEEAPFVHHGTPLATQILAIGDVLKNNGFDEALLREIYPRLKRFYDYMTGPRFRKPSGLLETWNIFYNSGGWDDYPPQWFLRPQEELRSKTTPMVSTSYYIRCAKILRLLATHMVFSGPKNGRKALQKDIRQYDADIAEMAKGILDNAWDSESGYFGYVRHDDKGKAEGLYLWTPEMGIPAQDGTRPAVAGTKSTNFDRGLDGVSPLVAGITSKEQSKTLLDHIFTEGELWSHCGITAVDQSAPYYRKDGYWNGTVWLPHQMILWKTMLDLGLPERARQIAETALKCWERECEDSYNCYEHFMIDSGRGGGWSNFSGLSSPIINWYNAYNKPGTVSTGFGTLVTKAEWAEDFSSVRLSLEFDKELVGKEVAIIVCFAGGPKEVMVKAGKQNIIKQL